jgi:hypothetical protein
MIAGDSSQQQPPGSQQQQQQQQQHHHQTRPKPASRAQNGLVLNDVPSFDSRELLRPTSTAFNSPYPTIQPSPRSPRPRARTFAHAKYLTDPDDPTRRSLPQHLTGSAMPPTNYPSGQQRHVSATAAEQLLRQQQQQQSQQQYIRPCPTLPRSSSLLLRRARPPAILSTMA